MAEAGLAESEKSGDPPVPEIATDCGLPAALSAIETEALRDPEAVGVNVTLMAQLAPAARVLPQVFVCAKSPAFAPVMLMLLMVSSAEPLLVSVIGCAALVEFWFCVAKVRVAGDRDTVGRIPVPLRVIVCGLPAALSVIDTEADRAPVAVGVNVTLTVQNAPAATEEPQEFV